VDIPRSSHLYRVTESFAKSKLYLLPVAILDPIGIGSVEALGIADHRYVARKDERVEVGIFFRPDAEGATDLIDGHAVQCKYSNGKPSVPAGAILGQPSSV
jgi:hypothetical protein